MCLWGGGGNLLRTALNTISISLQNSFCNRIFGDYIFLSSGTGFKEFLSKYFQQKK